MTRTWTTTTEWTIKWKMDTTKGEEKEGGEIALVSNDGRSNVIAIIEDNDGRIIMVTARNEAIPE